MRALLAAIDVGAGVDWAEAAIELGWFDQSHLIRDFKRHTGVTPSAYLTLRRPTSNRKAPGSTLVSSPTSEVKSVQEHGDHTAIIA
jgi:AraC-like DNA-binding protein